LGLIAAPPVVNRIVPEPRSSIGSMTVLSAATAPRTLNSSAARTSSTIVSSTGCMYSRAGTGEYSRTSIAPRRSASEPIAEDSAVASRMSAAAKSAVSPSRASSTTMRSSFSPFLDTRPTGSPSRPKRRAMAAPRFGPAPTITMDIRSDPPLLEPV
jgi:hypothetical protein